jgi:hypothetical protein
MSIFKHRYESVFFFRTLRPEQHLSRRLCTSTCFRNPSNRQFTGPAPPLLLQSKRGSADGNGFHLDRCVGNGVASHHVDRRSLRAGNRRQGTRFYEEDILTIVPFRLSLSRAYHSKDFLEQTPLKSNTIPVAFAPNQHTLQRTSLDALVSGDPGIPNWGLGI